MAKYNDSQCMHIMQIYIDTINNNIPLSNAKQSVLNIAPDFPIHNLEREINRIKVYLSGIGQYGYSLPSNWAKAFLKVTNNDPLVVKALNEQQLLYFEKDGKVNQKLEIILNEIISNKTL